MLHNIPLEDAFFCCAEAHFHLSRAIKKQHFCYWGENNLWLICELSLHSPKLILWCAVFQFGVLGPYFFEEEGQTDTDDSACYMSIPRLFLQPEIEPIVEEEDLGEVWFLQDGAIAQISRYYLNILRE